jgi:hypothetical protein
MEEEMAALLAEEEQPPALATAAAAAAPAVDATHPTNPNNQNNNTNNKPTTKSAIFAASKPLIDAACKLEQQKLVGPLVWELNGIITAVAAAPAPEAAGAAVCELLGTIVGMLESYFAASPDATSLPGAQEILLSCPAQLQRLRQELAGGGGAGGAGGGDGRGTGGGANE